MALVAGSVTVTSPSSWSGSGLALAMFDAYVAALEQVFSDQGAVPPDEILLPSMQARARFITAEAQAIITYFTANAVTSTPNVQGGSDTRTGTLS